MTQPLYQFTAPLVATMRDNMLRCWANGMIARGVPNPDISPSGDMYMVYTAVANEMATAMANTVIKSDETMPDTAAGAALDRWLTALGLKRRGATGSAGLVRFSSAVTSSPGVFIATGSLLLDQSQQRFEVTVGGSYYDGQLIPVEAVDLGAGTNHDNGATLTWITTPPYSQPAVLVGTLGGNDGLSEGADAEGDDAARERLLARLQNPPSAGNWQATVEYAEAATPKVEKGFCHPAIQGPSTTGIVITRRATATDRNRDVDAVTLSGTVAPYVAAQLPEHVYSKVTTVANVPTDVVLLLSLPSAPTASPPGPGGGWVDGAPWPSSVGGTTPVTVTAVADTTHITVSATTPPSDGVTHISYLDPTTWTIYDAIVTSHGGVSGAYTLELSAPLVNVATGRHVFPTSLNQAAYIGALLSAFAKMGPGEKTSNPNVLPRAYRHPIPSLAYPSSLGATQLRAVEDAGDEVLDTAWIYRSTTTPAVPGTVNDPSNILVPRNLSLLAA